VEAQFGGPVFLLANLRRAAATLLQLGNCEIG
jgi:hypothetical protein